MASTDRPVLSTAARKFNLEDAEQELSVPQRLPADMKCEACSMQLHKGFLAIALLALGASASAQSIVQTREVLTNRAIVTLAAAGFNEDFLIELILNSRTQFDTGVTGLTSLAKQGINERIIRVMLNSPGAVATGGDGEPLAMPAIAAPTSDGSPTPDGRPRIMLFRPKSADLAISAHAPYYRSTSVLWGLYKGKTGVGAATRAHSPLIPHLGMVYETVLSPGTFVPNATY